MVASKRHNYLLSPTIERNRGDPCNLPKFCLHRGILVAVATARQARKQKERPGTPQLLILFDIPPTNINDKYKSRLDAVSRNRIFARPNTFAHGIGCRDLLLTILFYNPREEQRLEPCLKERSTKFWKRLVCLMDKMGRNIY